jgi:ATP-dependent DNA ligase
MAECRWLKRQLVAQIEYADWTDVNHLCHSKFIAIRDDTPAKGVRARAVSRLKPRPLPYLQKKRAGKKRLGALGT